MRLMRHMQNEGFDPAFTNNAGIDYAFGIPLTFLGVDAADRSALCQFLHPAAAADAALLRLRRRRWRAAIAAAGISAVVIASGGMSHFPGTNRYSEPEVGFDRALFEILKTGNLRHLLSAR